MHDTCRTPEFCVCGHARAAHLHLRRGTDCGLCVRSCARYRRPSSVSELAGRALRALDVVRRA